MAPRGEPSTILPASRQGETPSGCRSTRHPLARERNASRSRVAFHEVARMFACLRPRRIRLVAYGARLESVLGESPRGFESPILRQQEIAPHLDF